MSYDRLAPTISSKAKKLFGSGNMGLSDGLDTRPCKILDLLPRLNPNCNEARDDGGVWDALASAGPYAKKRVIM